jgi:hypothetical protein
LAGASRTGSGRRLDVAKLEEALAAGKEAMKAVCFFSHLEIFKMELLA